MDTLRDIAMALSDAVAKMGPCELLSDGSDIPVFAFALRDPSKYTVFDVSNRLRQFGLQLPAYTMPAVAEDLSVLRLVVREGFSADLGGKLLADLGEAVAHLEK